MPKYMSRHKAIVVITGRAHCFHDNIHIYYAHLASVRYEHLCVVDHLWPLLYIYIPSTLWWLGGMVVWGNVSKLQVSLSAEGTKIMPWPSLLQGCDSLTTILYILCICIICIIKWLQLDSNQQPLSSETNTQPFRKTGLDHIIFPLHYIIQTWSLKVSKNEGYRESHELIKIHLWLFSL